MPPTQTNPQGRNSCVPACLRMVLAYQDIALSEGELCNLLNMQAAGTEVWNVLLLGEHLENCRINIDSISLDRMQESLIDNIAPIAVVVTQHLSYWQHNTIHAVVFVGITDEAIHVNDPTLPDAPRAVLRSEFLAAWSELDFLAIIVTVKQDEV